MGVHFFFLTSKTSLTNRGALKRFIIKIFKDEGHTLKNLNYVFCSDKHLLKLNKSYLNHNYLTDILTFNLSGTQAKAIEAEVYISVERVKENAKNISISFKNELHRVVFHGALHLCGYNDLTQKQKIKMREKENEYLNEYF